MTISDKQVLEMFRELPNHRGCAIDELNAIESQLSVSLPQRYRELLQLDAGRLYDAEIVAPIIDLHDLRQDAMDILIEDGHAYRLDADDVVFAWNDIYAFYFFKADGKDNPPVMMFNYYNADHDWTPVVVYDTLTAYFINALRRYLKIT